MCRRLTRRHVRTLMYHRFSPVGQGSCRRLPAEIFIRQLKYIDAHHEVWNADRLLPASLGQGPAPSHPPVVISIDDGYSDFYEVAFPILMDFSFPALVFLTTGFVSGRLWFWWDRLSYILAQSPAESRHFNLAQINTQGDPALPADRHSLWSAIANHLSTVPDQDKEKALEDLAQQLSVSVPLVPPADYGPVSWDQVREMADQGMMFGAHTVSHPILSRVDLDRAWEEIRASREELAGQIDGQVGWFCYPQGLPEDFLPETVALVQKAGFAGCFTAYPDATHDGFPFTLPRYSVSRDEVKFQWIMCGAEYLLMKWKARLGAKQR